MNSATRDRLMSQAIPTIFNVPNPPPAVTPKRSDPQKRKKAYQESQHTKHKMDIGKTNTLYKVKDVYTPAYIIITI